MRLRQGGTAPRYVSYVAFLDIGIDRYDPGFLACSEAALEVAKEKRRPKPTPLVEKLSGYVRGRSMMSSMIPYSFACCGVMMKSRSTSRSMRSSG